METKNSSYFGMVDVLRLVFAIGVAAIHTAAFESVNENLRIATSMGLCRIAVPFFFIVSGYFLYNRINSEKEPKATLKRLLILYLTWLGIEFITLSPMILSNLNIPILFLAKRLLFMGFTGSLWYISSLIITIFIIAPLLKRDKIIPLLIIGGTLYLFGATGDTYYGLFENTMVSSLNNAYVSVFLMPQVGITEAILFVTLGAIVNKYKLNEKIKKAGLLSVISILLLLIETFVLHKTGIAKDANMYLSVIIAAPLVFIWALNYNKNISTKFSKACKEYSLGIYCSHQIVLTYIALFIPVLYSNTLVRYICTVIISALIVTGIRMTKAKNILLK